MLSNWSLCATIRTGIFHHYQSTRQEGTWPKELQAICTMETRTIGGQICFAFLINLENGGRQAALTKTRCLWGTENVTVLETNMETWAECESQDHNGCRQLKLFYTNMLEGLLHQYLPVSSSIQSMSYLPLKTLD